MPGDAGPNCFLGCRGEKKGDSDHKRLRSTGSGGGSGLENVRQEPSDNNLWLLSLFSKKTNHERGISGADVRARTMGG